jgi:hypothetical protein
MEPKRPVKNTIIGAGVLTVIAFLAGYVPSCVKVKHLESDLSQARQENRKAQLRDLAGLAYLQASQKNYGLAAGTAARFFESSRETASNATESSRKSLEELSGVRDIIISKLAKGDPDVMNDLQSLSAKTRQATAVAAGESQR